MNDYNAEDLQKAFDQGRKSYVDNHEWIGLTDDEIYTIMPYCHNEFDIDEFMEFARQIEQKVQEKNEVS